MPTRTDYESSGRVTLATPDDIPELISIFWETFKGPGETLFPQTDAGRKWLESSFNNFLGRQSYYRPEAKVAVVRNPNGRPVSLALVHIVKPGQVAVGKSWKTRWARVDDAPGIDSEKLAGFFEPSAKAHHLVVGKEGHVFIEFLMTKYAYRRRGYATALVKWATNLADELEIPCYLDGGGRGLHICEKAGFVPQDVERRYGGPPPCVPMLRPKKE
ncbi:hypothetical protein F5Y15DRAFT_111620 [Xylariaceae sp. FL0016]|nr:hypothetical protein F5Y15DRAFT_111620 [Xylariaceae sp. FL0016]